MGRKYFVLIYIASLVLKSSIQCARDALLLNYDVTKIPDRIIETLERRKSNVQIDRNVSMCTWLDRSQVAPSELT